jgi:hypothetical protein
MANQETIDKITSIVYYLYHDMMMNPNAMAGSHKIQDVFDNACQLLLNMTAEQFAEHERKVNNG